MPAVLPIARISLKNILLTTDFSEASTAALPFALALARQYEAKLFVVHVTPAEPHLMVVTDRLPAQDDEYIRQARIKIDKFVHPEKPDIECKQLVDQGDLATVIPAIIREHDVDLVVLGTRGRRGLKKLVLGSHAEKIYRHASCPVLTVGPRVEAKPDQPWNIKHILFPVDLASESTYALQYALSLAEENEAELALLHAAPLVPWQHRVSTEERLRAEILSLIPPEAENWFRPEVVVRWDYPGEAIIQVAEERKPDLIVMGVTKAGKASSSHRPWPIASEVVGLALCPVLTVRG